jgi:hypothetical protein
MGAGSMPHRELVPASRYPGPFLIDPSVVRTVAGHVREPQIFSSAGLSAQRTKRMFSLDPHQAKSLQ